MKNIFYIAFLLFHVVSYSQTSTLKFVPIAGYEEEIDNWKSYRLEINGITYTSADTLSRIIRTNDQGFDRCRVIAPNDTLVFLAKFKKNENYVIMPNYCCSCLSIKAVNDSGRGTISFKNNTKKDLSIVSGLSSDTITKGQSVTMLILESAMCLHKPSRIVLAELEYHNHSIHNKEQENFIKDMVWFLFLHGEDIYVDYNETSGKIKLNLNGYIKE